MDRSGGPAFPRGQFPEIPTPQPRIEAQDGMTVLDHFAGIALLAILGATFETGAAKLSQRQVSHMAYQQGMEMVRVKRELEENDFLFGMDLVGTCPKTLWKEWEESEPPDEISSDLAGIFDPDSAEKADTEEEIGTGSPQTIPGPQSESQPEETETVPSVGSPPEFHPEDYPPDESGPSGGAIPEEGSPQGDPQTD